MIQVENLCFSYGHHKVLQNISFSADSGECVAILGNNGAGKSTLITCINRILTPESGKVLIDGKDVQRLPRKALSRHIAYVPQKNELTNATVFDCVLLGRMPYMKWSIDKSDLTLCEETLEKLHLSHLKLRNVDELSGGEMQKVMLARALVQQPKLLLLDEATSNLDPKNQYEMLSLVRLIAKEQEITVFMVLHDLNLALRFCDRFYFLKHHKGYCYGDLSCVTPETIETVYGIKAAVKTVENYPTVIFAS